MATELLSLYAKIGIDDSEYNKGIKGAESKAKKLGGGLKTAFAVGAAAVGVTAGAIAGMSKKLTDGVKATAEYGDNVDKMSQKMGISSKAYQEWDAVMKHSGTTIDALKPSMKTLATQAEKGSDAFQKLGISQEEVASLSQEDLFARTIEGLQNMEEGTERTALTSQLLGRGATELGALLNTSAEETQKMKDRVNELGGVMGDDAVKNAAAFEDQLQDMQTSFEGLKRNLLSDFMPAFTEAMGGLTEIFAGNTDEGVEQLSKGIEDIVSQVTEKLPTLLDVGSNIILAISESIITNLPSIIDAGISTIMTLANGLLEQLPLLLSAGIEILMALMKGITDNLPMLITTVVSIITELVTMLTNPDTLTQLIMAAVELILALANGLVEALPQLIGVLPVIITNVVTTLIKLAPRLLKSAKALISTLARGIVNGKSAAGEAIGKIFTYIGNKIKEFKMRMKEWAKDMMSNFVKGIGEKVQAVKDKFSEILNWIKDHFHFSVPDEGPLADADKWMPDFMDLLASGIDTNKFKVTNAIDDLAGDMVLDGGYDYGYEGGTEVQQFEFTFAEGNAPLLQIARMLFPYMKVVSKEKGVATW